MTSAKNFPISPAGQDLGLGDQLKMQLDAAEIERRKKLLQQANAVQRSTSQMGPATQTLFSGAGGFSV